MLGLAARRIFPFYADKLYSKIDKALVAFGIRN